MHGICQNMKSTVNNRHLHRHLASHMIYMMSILSDHVVFLPSVLDLLEQRRCDCHVLVDEPLLLQERGQGAHGRSQALGVVVQHPLEKAKSEQIQCAK